MHYRHHIAPGFGLVANYANCDHRRFKRNGLNTSKTRQRWKCVLCGTTYTEDPIQIHDRLRIISMVAPYYLAGRPIRESARCSGLSVQTVWKYFQILREYRFRHAR